MYLRIDDIIDGLRDCRYFTVLDVNSAFWTIKLRKRIRRILDHETSISIQSIAVWLPEQFGTISAYIGQCT